MSKPRKILTLVATYGDGNGFDEDGFCESFGYVDSPPYECVDFNEDPVRVRRFEKEEEIREWAHERFGPGNYFFALIPVPEEEGR